MEIYEKMQILQAKNRAYRATGAPIAMLDAQLIFACLLAVIHFQLSLATNKFANHPHQIQRKQIIRNWI